MGLQKGQHSPGEGGGSLWQTGMSLAHLYFGILKLFLLNSLLAKQNTLHRSKLVFSYQSVIPGSFRNFHTLSVGANIST